MTRPKGAVSIAQSNVTGTPIQRAAAIIALADMITKTEADDDDIIDVLKHMRQKTTPENIAAVRAVLRKGKGNG